MTEHIEDRHEQRAEDGEASPMTDCADCEAAFPEYFAEMRQARREYDAYRNSGHKLSHDERGRVEWVVDYD